MAVEVEQALTDEVIVARVLAGERDLLATLMRRSNRRIFRVVRSIVRSDDEAEDVMQEAYVRAYEHLHQFASRSSWLTWVTRIALHEAMARARRDRRYIDDEEGRMSGTPTTLDSLPAPDASPESRAGEREVLGLVEKAVDSLPESFRTVFILREVEGLDTRETAECLDVPEETVKTRLHRAKERVRTAVAERIAASTHEAYAFHLSRCDRVVNSVMKRIA